MIKWNSSQLLDFLSSNLIVESKMEDEQKSKLYYKAAKYCFDKFKSNSFKRTEFSVKELEKIGIKNIKYPLYTIMVGPKGEYEKIFYDNTNLGGFLNFDSKINSFYIAILKRQEYKTYEDFFNIFLHEFTHFLQFKSVQNPKSFFIPWSIESLTDCYFYKLEGEHRASEDNEKIREDIRYFFYYLNNIEIYARNNELKNGKNKIEYLEKVKTINSIYERLSDLLTREKDRGIYGFNDFQDSKMDSEKGLQIKSIVFLFFMSSLYAPKKIWNENDDAHYDFNARFKHYSFIDKRITETKDFKKFKKNFFEFYSKKDLFQAIECIKKFIDTREKFEFLVNNIIENFKNFYEKQLQKVNKIFNYHLRSDFDKDENFKNDISLNRYTPSPYGFDVNFEFRHFNKFLNFNDDKNVEKYKRLFDFMNANFEDIASNLENFKKLYNETYLKSGREIKSNFRENIDLSVVATPYDRKTGKSLSTNFADGLDLKFSTVSGNSASHLVQSFEFANISKNNRDVIDSPLGRNKFPDYYLMGLGVDCKTYNVSDKDVSRDEIKTGNTGLTLKELLDVIVNIFTGKTELFNPNDKNMEKSKFFPYCYFAFLRYRRGKKDKQGQFIESKSASEISNTVRIEDVNIVPALYALDNSLSSYSLKNSNPYIKISDKNNISKFINTKSLYQLLFDILYKLYHNYGIDSLFEMSGIKDDIGISKNTNFSEYQRGLMKTRYVEDRYTDEFKRKAQDAHINSLYKDSFSTVAFMNYLYFLSKGKLKVPETGLTKFKNLLNMHKEHDIHEVKPKYSEDDREFKRESEELFNVN